MAPRIPRKLSMPVSKKSLITRDSTGGGSGNRNNNNEGGPLSKSLPVSSPSMTSKFKKSIASSSHASETKNKPSAPPSAESGGVPAGVGRGRGAAPSGGVLKDDNKAGSTRGPGQNSSEGANLGRNQQPFETSEGAMRLNRILDSTSGTGTSAALLSPSPSARGGGTERHSEKAAPSRNAVVVGGSNLVTSSQSSNQRFNNNNAAQSHSTPPPPPDPSSAQVHGKRLIADYIPPSTIALADPTNEVAVGEMTCRISSKMRVDARSIGGQLLSGEGKVEARTGNFVLRDGWEELLLEGGTPKQQDGENGDGANGRTPVATSSVPKTALQRPMNRLTNECLFSMCVSQFDLSVGVSGGPSGGKKRHIPIAKSRNKLRYVVIMRSTNRPLLRPRVLGVDMTDIHEEDSDGGEGSGDDIEDLGSDDGYDNMYNPDPDGSSTADAGARARQTLGVSRKKAERGQFPDRREKQRSDNSNDSKKPKKKKKPYEEYNSGIPTTHEVSSFPALICLAVHADGTKPDVRKILELDKLVSIENCAPNRKTGQGAGNVVLVFRNGDAVEIDTMLPNAALMHSTGIAAEGGTSRGGTSAMGSKKSTAIDTTNRLRKERFLWSLLQIHAILCTSVVERTTAAAVLLRPGVMATSLPPLVVRDVDRGELQYVSTVNGFLTDSPVLCSLLDRQSNHNRGSKDRVAGGEGAHGGSVLEKRLKSSLLTEGEAEELENEDLAYDMMMGNYNRVALFVNDAEKLDAADVLNHTAWQQHEITSDGSEKVDASATAETLMALLNKRMRELEAETCRRLIRWEDEKYSSAIGERGPKLLGNGSGTTQATGTGSDGVKNAIDAMSVNDLYNTLQKLDEELELMESWIEDRATVIKPITDECRGIEEENRMLEQQWISYETLGSELKRLLGGIVLPSSLMKVLKNPGSVIVYDKLGTMDIGNSEEGVELIHQAGQALKIAIDAAEGQGGIHLKAVSDTVKVLSMTSNEFCGSLARIVVTVMEQLAKEVCGQPEATVGKGDTHTSIAKKIRDTQRQFQASLLSYIKIIEVLALLKPDILPAVRDAYSELVAEGIMNKKRMKQYFASLPGRTSVKIANDVNFDKFDALALPGRTSASVTHDLGEYAPVSLSDGKAAETSGMMKPVNVEDIEAALSEMLPLIAREAYFTAALFGLSSRHLDGRQKKRNFEAAKKSVDNSSQYFRYYMNRICGIASKEDAEGKKVKGDAMLSLVASIHLNEAMDGYIDRNKKGGDHSLSLAYVRATILDLRKKVDKQWVIWVEDQIKWIRTNPGVPPNGKRAGIFASISRLPSYLDHVLICCKAGRPKDYTPNLAKIKVVSYYLQKMASALFASLNECAERETTDQQYAANVMRMENAYFFTQGIKQRGIETTTLFQKQITGASVICKQSTDAYLGWMIKREFKAMHSLFSNISRVRKDVGDADVPIHVPRAQFVRTLQKESSKEIMKEKIGVVYARMEKHLSESGGLLPVAWKALVKVLYEWFGRWEKLSTSCYKFILEPSAIDVVRIAKAASGVSTSSSGKKVIEGKPEKHKYVSI